MPSAAERPSSAAAATTGRAAEPTYDTPSAAAPGSASAAVPQLALLRSGMHRPPLHRRSIRLGTNRMFDHRGHRSCTGGAESGPVRSRGIQGNGCGSIPQLEASLSSAERPSSAAAATTHGAAQPPPDTPSAAAPGSAGAPPATRRDATAWPGPTPPTRFGHLRGRPRRQGYAGRRGRVPEARDRSLRERPAEPPERVHDLRCREGRTCY